VLALLEAQRHFRDDRYGDAALRGAAAIAAAVDHEDNCSLYFGLAGMAVALHAVHTQLGEASAAADRAMDRVRSGFDGQRWGPMFELLAGNAGIALGALHAGDVQLAVLAAEPYLRAADPTPGGVNWAVRPSPPRSHHIAHGTLGIVYALAAVGAAAGRRDLTELALAGAADVAARDEAGPAGFLVPHSDPQHRPDLIERYSYGWCNSPAGHAQVFRLLGAVTKDPAWAALADRCWLTVIHCGLPRRVRPGFWDNNGRCRGTAGVLALACDRHVEQPQPLDFANVLVGDLATRATTDADGVRWSNHEHRATPSALEPRTGWAMGNAGIIASCCGSPALAPEQTRPTPSCGRTILTPYRKRNQVPTFRGPWIVCSHGSPALTQPGRSSGRLAASWPCSRPVDWPTSMRYPSGSRM
jgi:Lanthionine synthetase C-like protein